MGSYKIAYFDGSHRFTDIDFCIRCGSRGAAGIYRKSKGAELSTCSPVGLNVVFAGSGRPRTVIFWCTL